ncbi:23S rRNA (guanosine(2251)-2'-O)-methyltransferase RlmB [Desulfolithobacter dissulfuricans]|nr:23S rRNA (guanosine(2251)-2'-O)-methyltransferase RlmB [Desulfolithobacter dissulfuricans]
MVKGKAAKKMRGPGPGGGKQQSQEVDQERIWGLNAVQEALRSPGNIEEILVVKGKGGPKIQAIIETARRQGVRLRFVERNRLGVAPSCRHQGVVARQTQATLVPLERLLASLEEQSSPRLLVLDSIQDPRNLGSILRSALAAGFGSVILTRDRSAPLSGTVARTSAGAVTHLQIAQVGNLRDTLALLKERGLWIYGAVVGSEAGSIYETDCTGPVALVIGSEGKGIRPLVRKECDHLITIPMAGDFDSLNASVAAGIIMFEIKRQQEGAG